MEQVTPFTNETLAPDRVREVQRLFARYGANEPDRFGCYVVHFADGSSTEVFGKDLESGCSVALRGMTDDCATFLYELLVAGDWIAIPADDEPHVLAPSNDCVTNWPEELSKVLVINSAREMQAALTGGLDAWRAYRDKVIGPR